MWIYDLYFSAMTTIRHHSAEQKKNILVCIRKQYRINKQLGIRKICSQNGISSTTYYRWIQQERKSSLEPLSRKPKKFGNKLDDSIRNAVIKLWKKHPHLSANKIHKLCLDDGHSISYNTVNKIIKEQLRQDTKRWAEINRLS